MEDTPEIQQEQEEVVDPSHELDLVTIFESQGAEAESEAMALEGVLKANDIPVVLVGSSTLPNLPFMIQVPTEMVEVANATIKEARAAGPAAAEEAERISELQGNSESTL
ncbi:MAG TPA: hypothetical protein VM120_25870 [Bryobacteraceae bacterium]|nr:hypothetical protein [Bryobacteraceae bacterium]